jgi:hypothetical protein
MEQVKMDLRDRIKKLFGRPHPQARRPNKDARTKVRATISAKLIKADGTTEDRGIVWTSDDNKEVKENDAG